MDNLSAQQKLMGNMQATSAELLLRHYGRTRTRICQ